MFLKKLLYFVVLLFISSGMLFGGEGSVSAEPMQVVTENWPPYSFEEDGLVKGSATEIVRKVMNRLDIDYHIKVLPWARTYHIGLNNSNVAIFALGRTPPRESSFHWIGEVTPRTKYFFYKLKSRQDIIIETHEDAKKYSISATRATFIQKKLEADGFKFVYQVIQQDQSYGMLILGRADLIIRSEKSLQPQMEKLGLDPEMIEKVLFFTETKSYLAFSLQTPINFVKRAQKIYTDLFSAKIIPSFEEV